MTLDHFLAYAYPRLVQALLLAWAASFVYARRDLQRAAGAPFKRRELWILAGIFAAGAALRFFLAPRAHMVLWDEIEVLDQTRNFHRMGAFAKTVAGGLPDLDVLDMVGHWPPVFPVLCDGLYRIFGYAENRAFALNLLLSSLTVPVFAVAVALLWDSAAAGLAAGILLAFDPLHLKYSASGDLTASSIFWLSAAVLAIAAAARRPGPKVSLLAQLTIAVAVHTRPENVLLYPFAYLAWRRAPSPREWAAAAAVLPPLVALVIDNHSEETKIFGTAFLNFLSNAGANLSSLASAQPAACLAAAAALSMSRRRAAAALAAAWFAAFFAVSNSHAFGLYAVPAMDRIYLPAMLAVFASAAAFKSLTVPRAAALALLLAAPGWSGWAEKIAVASEDATKAAWLRELAPFVAPGESVATFSPEAIRAISGRPAVSLRWLAEHRTEFGSRPLVFFRDYWTNVFPEDSRRLEAELRRDYDFKEIASREIGGFSYPLFRLTPKTR